MFKGRTTRSGNNFSPYDISVGEPVIAPASFSLRRSAAQFASLFEPAGSPLGLADICDVLLQGDLDEAPNPDGPSAVGLTLPSILPAVNGPSTHRPHGDTPGVPHPSNTVSHIGNSSHHPDIPSIDTDASGCAPSPLDGSPPACLPSPLDGSPTEPCHGSHESVPAFPQPASADAASGDKPSSSHSSQRAATSSRNRRRRSRKNASEVPPTSTEVTSRPPIKREDGDSINDSIDAIPAPTQPEDSRHRRNHEANLRRRARLRDSSSKGDDAFKRSAKARIVKACIAKWRLKAWEMAIRVKLAYSRDLLKNVTSSRWTCKHPRGIEVDRTQYAPLDLKLRFSTRVINWNGTDCCLLMDINDEVFGALGGMPKGEDWARVHSDAVSAMKSVRASLSIPPKYQEHRRGQYPALSYGISYGGGQMRPSNLKWSPSIAEALMGLTQNTAFQRLSGFANCLFRTYAPRMYDYYSDTLDDIQRRQPYLVRPFPESAFAACCFNLGPQTVSYPHRDHANLAWGWCAITALGSYDPDKGGHLILWDLNCIIRFPPGSTILIPSALLEHSNASILAGEERFSFVQFSAGSLFRWVENGFQTEERWFARAKKQDLQQREDDLLSRWSRGMDMLSTIGEFGPSA